MEHVSWEPSLGSYVWAKLPSYPWWPGIVAPDTNGHHRRGNRYNVNFYNDTQHAWVARENLVSFAENMDKCVKPTHRLYAAVQKAIAEAIQDGALQSTRLSSDEPAPKPGLSRETELGKALDQESEDTEQSIAAAAESMNEKTRSRSVEAPPSSAPTLKRLKQKRKIPADDSDGTETAGSSSEYDAVHDPEESDASLVQSDDDSMANAKGRARAAKTHSSRQRRAPKTGAADAESLDHLNSSSDRMGTPVHGTAPRSRSDKDTQQRVANSSSRDERGVRGRSEYSRQLATLRQQNAQMKARLALLERKLEKYPPAPPEPTPLTLDAIRASVSGLTSRRSIGAEDLIRLVRGLEESADMLSELHQTWTDRCNKYRECVARLEDLRLAAAHAAEAFELEERRIALQLAELLRYQVTLEILRTSRAGKPIKSLGKSLSGKSAVIERLSDEIVSKWKAVVTEAQRESETSAVSSGAGRKPLQTEPVVSGHERTSNDLDRLREESKVEPRPPQIHEDNHDPASSSGSRTGFVADIDLDASAASVGERIPALATLGVPKRTDGSALGSDELSNMAPNGSASNTDLKAISEPQTQVSNALTGVTSENMIMLATESLPLPPGKRGDIVRALCEVFIAAATEEATDATLNAATTNLFRSICIDLERAINAKFSFDFARPDYSAKYRDLKANLRRNADLRLRLLRQELTPAEVVDMTAEQLKTAQAREREAVIAERMLYHKQRGIPQAASTDQFRCGKCGQRACTYFQMQTRSADEPMTTFVTCMHCGNRWKC
ncbi:hypothetical protein CCYA_CCYA01G0109 [Cyanidiococcus yangmingshanensis]|nr:hypothetical protein CCYA_CCYA01G0109 [Cyanidiococcus yangmingshanensis]